MKHDTQKISDAAGQTQLPACVFTLGLKTDPIMYRYSYDWLFKLLAVENVRHVQLGTFFELYDLPDAWFRDLRTRAEDYGISITSVFTAHRELGGFFREDGPGWTEVAHRNMHRLIDVAAMLGARSAGANPGAVLRDQMSSKPAGVQRYMEHFKQLMHHAGDRGLQWLTIEPMSCIAEPPTLPDEIIAMAQELHTYHLAHPGTARPGYCIDIAHGYADSDRKVVHDHFALMQVGLPYTSEVHLKNTDALYNATFGFSEADRQRGIVDVSAVRAFYARHSSDLPVHELIGYLEIGGPKLGRDYSDGHLGPVLRASLKHLREAWEIASPNVLTPCAAESCIKLPVDNQDRRKVTISPSLMCADLLNLEQSIDRLRAAGAADMLHVDIMDGHFAPNLTLGLTLIEQLRPNTDIPLDVHLMVNEPEQFIPALVKIGVNRVSVHVEAVTHLDRLLDQLRDAGISAGVAINPATPLSVLDYVADCIDFVLVMTVNPGFAGQKLFSGALRKIADCRCRLGDLPVKIEVDGNVSFANIPGMVAAGADELVAGSSSIFSTEGTLEANAHRMRQAIHQGIRQQTAVPVISGGSRP
jgi:ribulose-phosphate 3-epimerase